MNSDKIASFKKRLEGELAKVEGELKGIAVQDPNNPKNWSSKETEMETMAPTADPNEAADKIEEYNEHRAITGELEIRYNDIKAALEKIESGTYGVCEVSGEEIEEERLEANPAARTCKKHL
jgi:RNA polymerase-binding transcription factor DksA